MYKELRGLKTVNIQGMGVPQWQVGHLAHSTGITKLAQADPGSQGREPPFTLATFLAVYNTSSESLEEIPMQCQGG